MEGLRIGNLLLDPSRRELSRDGESIELPRLSYKLLLVLAQAAPNVLTQDELMESVWPGRVISPETLTQRIMLLRQAIGDDAAAPSYIGLVRGEGYRMLAPVQPLPEENSIPARRGNSYIPVSTFGLVVLAIIAVFNLYSRTDLFVSSETSAPENAIAILPFTNLSGDPEDDYLSGGLGDELLDQLGRVPGLRIAARPSSKAVRARTDNVVEMARQLGVGTLVEGSLRRQGNNLRISIQIIDGNTGFQRWSQSYDRSSRDLLAIQQQIAVDVVNQILPDVAASEENVTPATFNVSTHDLLLLARHYENLVRDSQDVDLNKLDKVIEIYRRAAESDPNSAIAYSRLGGALLYAGKIDAAEEPIFTALNLNPDLSEVQTTLGTYFWLRNLPGSADAWERAIELNPYNADALSSYAWWRWHQGENDTPQPLYERALDIDPLSLSRLADLGNFFGMSGKVPQTEEVAQRVVELFHTPEGYSLLARLYELMGKVDQAIEWGLKAYQAKPRHKPYAWQVAELYSVLGDFESALHYETDPGLGLLYRMRRYDELIDLGEELMIDQPQDENVKFLLAFAYNATGQYAKAVRVLTLAGLPDLALGETHRSSRGEALSTLTDALYQTGEIERARTLAEWTANFMSKLAATGNLDWWPYLYQACAFSVLGQTEKVLPMLGEINASPRLPWLPLLEDARCFDDFRDTPEFQALITSIIKRQTLLLKKVRETQ